MKLVLVGGFLGAGKTTLIGEVARRLTQRGRTVGLITNDQAPDLVDTAILSRSGSNVREVAGSCFCCNFNGFKDAVQHLVDDGAEYIVAEPVGSCTDLSATIIQPLKALYPAYSVAPLSVLVDPVRAREVLDAQCMLLHADAAYIFRLQLEEADRIVLNKADTLTEVERNGIMTNLKKEFPRSSVFVMSALTGEGIDSWLKDILDDSVSGATIAEVDYDRYANGEAVLGWLNAVLDLRWTGSLEPHWEDFLSDLFAALKKEFRETRCEIGHVKMLLESSQGRIAANLTGLNEPLSIRREGNADRLNAVLTVNARVQVSPDGLESAFRSALSSASYARIAPAIRALHCIKPGRPEPTYRYESVVA